MNYFKVLLFSVLILFSFDLYGQSQIGIYAGLNSGKLSGDSPGRFKYVSGRNLAIGLGYDLQLKDDIFLSFQTSFVNASSKLQHPKEVDEEEILEDSISLDIRLITVPILLKLISDNKKFQFSGGFELAFPVKFMADNSAESVDLMGGINKVNINMLFGIGYRIPINKSQLIINLTYSQGLTNLANNLDDADSLLPRIKYTSFQLTAGWYLPVGKNKFQQPSN
jgi:hypothetical protein